MGLPPPPFHGCLTLQPFDLYKATTAVRNVLPNKLFTISNKNAQLQLLFVAERGKHGITTTAPLSRVFAFNFTCFNEGGRFRALN